MIMTAFSRAFILAGLVAVAGTTGALADPRDNHDAQTTAYGLQQNQENPVLQEGRSAFVETPVVRQEQRRQDENERLLNLRSSEWN
jgi:hypothetical protein